MQHNARRGKDFYKLDTDDEPTEDDVESEATEYFKNAKSRVNIQILDNCF